MDRTVTAEVAGVTTLPQTMNIRPQRRLSGVIIDVGGELTGVLLQNIIHCSCEIIRVAVYMLI